MKKIQASRNNAISLQVAIEEYFRDNNLDEEIVDYDFGNGAFTEWHFYCDGDDFKYIDDNNLYDYIADLREFRNENFEVFSFRDEISIKILDDEYEESKKSARKSIKESVPFTKIMWSDDFSSQEMANLIRNKFDISVSYFSEDGDFGIRIKTADCNSKILNFINKKVNVISTIEESKKSIHKSIREKEIGDKLDDFYFEGYPSFMESDAMAVYDKETMLGHIKEFYTDGKIMSVIAVFEEFYVFSILDYKKKPIVMEAFNSYNEAKRLFIESQK